MQTRYSYLTDAELLRMLDHKRTQSPVIDELCNRLDKRSALSAGTNNHEHTEGETRCPVCEAVLPKEQAHD